MYGSISDLQYVKHTSYILQFYSRDIVWFICSATIEKFVYFYAKLIGML